MSDELKPVESDTEALSEGLEGTLEPAAESSKNADGNTGYNPDEWTGPVLKDPKTGRFLAGTGVSRKGGRPKGSKDKITNTMVSLASATLEQHGERMWRDLSNNDPVACLALISKLLPNADLSAAIQGAEDNEDNHKLRDISIRLVSDNTKALEHDDVPKLTDTGD